MIKLMIVGGFPPKGSKIFGGVVRSCNLLMESDFANKFDIIPFDSTQVSIPAPHLSKRLVLSFSKIIRFVISLIIKRPNVCLIFLSDGLSAIEKGVFIWLCKLVNCKIMIFPRAGGLMAQTRNSAVFRGVVKALFSGADVFLCQGKTWKKYAIQELGFNPDATLILNNWTATRQLIEVGDNRSFKPDSSCKTILFVGWIEDFKGTFELLEVFGNLVNEGLDIKLRLVGDGSAKDRLQKIVYSGDLTSRVQFDGWCEEKELRNILGSADIFVLPSWSEGLPNAMIEALAAGLAVIVTRVGTIPDFLTNKQHAILIRVNDVNGLQRGIRNLVTDEPLRYTLAQNGRKLAKENFSLESEMEKLSGIVKELAFSSNSARPDV